MREVLWGSGRHLIRSEIIYSLWKGPFFLVKNQEDWVAEWLFRQKSFGDLTLCGYLEKESKGTKPATVRMNFSEY